MQTVRSVVGFVAGLFLRGNGGVKFARSDFFGAGVDVAELAGGKVVFGGAHRWAEGAAEDGAMLVEVAGAMFEVEYGAGLVVGELFEEDGGFIVLVENAGGSVSGKPWIEPGKGVCYAGVNAGGSVWVCLFEGEEAFTEACGVLVSDGEDADAALRTARFADQMVAAAGGGGGQGGIYDLDEGLLHRASEGVRYHAISILDVRRPS
jgi:hypothetical protein